MKNYVFVVAGLSLMALLMFTVGDKPIGSVSHFKAAGLCLFFVLAGLSVAWGMLNNWHKQSGPLFLGTLGSLALMATYRWLV